jgi:hypothetical protein
MTLDWVRGVETPYPERPEDAFPGEAQRVAEPWDALRQQFLAALEQTAEMAHDTRAAGADDVRGGPVALKRGAQCVSSGARGTAAADDRGVAAGWRRVHVVSLGSI